MDGHQIMVRCEGGLRRSEELDVFEKQAKDDKRAFYPELVPPFIGDARLLLRGDILQPSVIIGRRFPVFFTRANSKLTTLKKSPTKCFTAQGSGRLQLAEWLTQADSIQAALVARTAVNRVWQHLFGEGLCRTPKELGRLGHVPVLPELIDGLAVRFIARRWSLKSLVREIVLSKAYRRSSIGSDTQFKADPQNVCVSRQAVKRLESEPIMNTMAYLRHGKRFVGPEARNSNLLGFDEFFRNYDGPTTDDLIDRRVASISATQALFMMNNGSVSKVIAAGLSKRIRGTDNLDLPSILQPIYLTVLQRHPSERESKIAAASVARRRKQTGQVDHVAEIREFIHLLLCGNELIYIE